ncbi:MAG: hypothetical protein ACOYMV_12545 [Verrucomicrobiia bacterium]
MKGRILMVLGACLLVSCATDRMVFEGEWGVPLDHPARARAEAMDVQLKEVAANAEEVLERFDGKLTRSFEHAFERNLAGREEWKRKAADASNPPEMRRKYRQYQQFCEDRLRMILASEKEVEEILCLARTCRSRVSSDRRLYPRAVRAGENALVEAMEREVASLREELSGALKRL